MALALNSLRSHFFKQLSCTTVCAATATFSGLIAPPQKRFPTASGNPLPLRSLGLIPSTTATFARLSSSETLADDDTFTSPYLSARIFCPRDSADLLSGALLCFGASSITMDEHDDSNVNEEDVEDCISRSANSLGLKETPNYHVEMHDHTDWIRKTQESFHPVQVKDGVWVVPEWTTPPEVETTNIILNPGLAFGTGEHPTTKLCLLLLHNLIKGGEFVLDYGTGSGVLAIAALKFGAALSVGVDLDPQAITSATHNAALNKMKSEKLVLHLVATTDDTKGVFAEKDKYDIVVANILLNPLLDLADQLVSYAKPGAMVALSGIITEQVPSIMERYSHFLDGMTSSEMDGWACVNGYKKA